MNGALEGMLREEVGDALRSVTTYTPDDFELVYMRDDLEQQYTDSEVRAAVEELRLQTFEQAHINDIYRANHGELQCEIQWFADAIEMNFPLGDGVGVSVAIDATHYVEQNTLIKQIWKTIDAHADPG